MRGIYIDIKYVGVVIWLYEVDKYIFDEFYFYGNLYVVLYGNGFCGNVMLYVYMFCGDCSGVFYVGCF